MSSARADEGHLTPVLDRNVRALIERRRAEERAERWHDVVLAMAASVEAIFLSTFILISQNRMQAEDEDAGGGVH